MGEYVAYLERLTPLTLRAQFRGMTHRILLLALLASGLFAQIRVLDTYNDPNGGTTNATCTLNGFASSYTRITAGVIDWTVQPLTSPALYTIVCSWTSLGVATTEYWRPLASNGTTQTLTQVRISGGATPGSNLTATSPIVKTGSDLSCPTCLVSTGSYASPAWITSLAGAKLNAASVAISKLIIGGTPNGSKFLRDDETWAVPPGSVTSVGLTTSDSSVFTITNTPVTSSGSIAFSFTAQTGRKFIASPSDGSSGAMTARALVSADLPSHSHAAGDTTSGTFSPSRIPALGTLSGQLDLAQIFIGGTGSTTNFLRGTGSWSALVAGDLPSHSASLITSGALASARGGLGVDASGFTGIVKWVAGVPSIITGTALDCIKVNASSGSCGGVVPGIPYLERTSATRLTIKGCSATTPCNFDNGDSQLQVTTEPYLDLSGTACTVALRIFTSTTTALQAAMHTGGTCTVTASAGIALISPTSGFPAGSKKLFTAQISTGNWAALTGAENNTSMLSREPEVTGTNGVTCSGNACGLTASGATPGTYTNPSITVDTYGRTTSISSGAAGATDLMDFTTIEYRHSFGDHVYNNIA
jgi:hypothetical protein